MRQESREGGFSYSAFTREDEDLVSDLRESLGDDRDIGVGAFGCGGTNLLVGTASTGIALAGFLGLGTRAVFCNNREY